MTPSFVEEENEVLLQIRGGWFVEVNCQKGEPVRGENWDE